MFIFTYQQIPPINMLSFLLSLKYFPYDYFHRLQINGWLVSHWPAPVFCTSCYESIPHSFVRAGFRPVTDKLSKFTNSRSKRLSVSCVLYK